MNYDNYDLWAAALSGEDRIDQREAERDAVYGDSRDYSLDPDYPEEPAPGALGDLQRLDAFDDIAEEQGCDGIPWLDAAEQRGTLR